MPTSAGIGFSQNPDSVLAAQEAAEEAFQQLRQKRIDMVFVFSTPGYAPREFLPIIHTVLDQSKLIGCSAEGIIHSDRISLKGIGVLALQSDNIKFETGHISHLNLQDIHEAARTLIKQSQMEYGEQFRKLFLLFADSTMNNFGSLITGMKDTVGRLFPIIGGGSSSGFNAGKSYQYFSDKFMTKSVSGVFIGGHVSFGTDCQHGWKALGKPRILTQVDNNIIKTIDGRKAIEMFREYFAEDTDLLMSNPISHLTVRYPLGIAVKNPKGYILRNVLQALDDGSIVCQDKMPQGATVHLMLGNKESCLTSAQSAAIKVKQDLKQRTPRLIVVIESFLRYKLLGRAAAQEIQLIKDILGKDCPLFGMYSMGEIFTYPPVDNFAETRLMNNSIIILAVS